MSFKKNVLSFSVLMFLMVAMFSGTAAAAINVTQITNALDVIWALVDNIGDNFDSILTLIMFGVVITLIYIFRDFLAGMFGSILSGMGNKKVK